MNIVELSTGEIFPIEILPLESADYNLLNKERYFFNWKEEKEQNICKLIIKRTKDILGLISFEIIPEELRVHIRLLTVSAENKGKNKKYDKIAGNLIAYVAKIAVKEFGEFACVSLKPKTAIYQHYIDKYKMYIAGQSLCLEVPEILDIIKEYEDDH
ncbi:MULTISPECIES: N-acetyltransferase [Chryseobacterium]|uniref:N-acetyltransferase n=1 Tax=Candidatus Chryseobacterium massiliense TaxID=204089 RepID=A0A3D9AV92_9FLAO|nr:MULTISPECIES: N-acetyltransferase [Chryseobacterium]REC45233.1 N-acetyltransferase [Candidatus Chryseobacterium massiliae]WBX95522.1 N-acetyltransferase [Chryseobacterium gambrini]